MATVKGLSAVKSYLANARDDLIPLARGAARAAAKVVEYEAKLRSVSSEVDDAIKISRAREDGGIVTVKVQVKGKGSHIGLWLEYGTDPHFISVDDSQRGGKSVNRINREMRSGSLVIGGTFVGKTVFHPGASPHPFLRPAFDVKESEAIAAAQDYLDVRIGRAGRGGLGSADE